ncbi:hypothetical protein CP532_6623 [Ophiocordyceps camponoti-leonardi (nom. inval.)]|nr:hypothetical protein CP532_6623 [Ophiocordyceps camponoti-leonardi (nom. inval.)]
MLPGGATVEQGSPDMSATATITRRDARQASTTLVAAAPAIRPVKRTSSRADLRDESPTKRSSSLPGPGSNPLEESGPVLVANPEDVTSPGRSQPNASVKNGFASEAEYIRHMEQRLAQSEELVRVEKAKNARLPLENYLTTQHDLVYKTFETRIVRPPPVTSNTTTGTGTGATGAGTKTMTCPVGKFCPTDLRPWDEFASIQKKTFQDLAAVWDENKLAFSARIALEDKARELRFANIREENDISHFLDHYIETPAKLMVEELRKEETVTGRFNISNGISYQGDSHETRENTDQPSTSSRPRGKPDRYCCQNAVDGTVRTIIHVSEYKRPQNLTKDVIERGLYPMNIFKDVSSEEHPGKQAGEETKANFHAKKLIGAALTQTFDYIIENGLEYGVLTTGEAFIFLKVDWNEPAGRLYYHLAYPGQDVENAPEGMSHQLTAVGQYLAFTLMAAGEPGTIRDHDQDTKDEFRKKLARWGDSKPPTPESSFENNDDDSDSANDDDDGDDGPGSGGPAQGTRSKTSGPRTRSKTSAQQSTRSNTSAQGSGQQTQGSSSKNNTQQNASSQHNTMFKSLGGPGSKFRGPHEGDIPYCTQKCLAGIASGAALDNNCPNVALHRGNKQRTHHRLNQTQFIDHLSKQLKWSLDRGVTPLGMNGACGFTFKVTLLLYGYTMISKGTVEELARYLRQETVVYERLRPIQGKHVPVCLGLVDLRTFDRAYFYPFGYNITHMMFLAWGGTAANRIGLDNEGIQAVEEKADKALKACHDLGVIHEDIRLANMVVSEEGDKVMMIDFERAEIVEPRRKTLVDKTNRQPRAPRTQPSGSGPSSAVKKSPSPASKKRAQNAETKPRQETSRKTLADKTNRQPRVQRTQRSGPGPSSTLKKSPSPTSKKLAQKVEMEPQREPGRNPLSDKTKHQGRTQNLTIRQTRMQPSQSSGSGTSLTSKKRTRNTETEPSQAARAKRIHMREEACWEEPRWQLRGRTVLVKTDRQPRAQTSGSGPSLTSKKRSRDCETEPSEAVRAKKIHLRHGSWDFRHKAGKSEWSMDMASRMAIV